MQPRYDRTECCRLPRKNTNAERHTLQAGTPAIAEQRQDTTLDIGLPMPKSFGNLRMAVSHDLQPRGQQQEKIHEISSHTLCEEEGAMHGKYSGKRCKVPWPFATREMLVTSFELELPELDAVVPQEAETIVKETIHGFNASHLPPPKEGVIRMEANGGFILQKISDEKCYIRAVIHLDLKLDLVPTWVINFLGRQVVGHGFRLYLKTVSSVKESKVFQECIRQQPLYSHITLQMLPKSSHENGYKS
ncbi:hypothetical protein SELMODRAFT_428364 [Selaginella moellendorffii]|uniref:START domain-containing protein n=1 Tax=Selaginella moellendorffii TaxID=88036 RepID=D8T2L0_SELML|nr:hypothetical protein SELMODRAFT_428364 [Selaginella moellendorffii]